MVTLTNVSKMPFDDSTPFDGGGRRAVAGDLSASGGDGGDTPKKPYDERFRDSIDGALGDIGLLDRRGELDTKDSKPVKIRDFRLKVRRLSHGIERGKITSENAYSLFWKHFEKLKSEFLSSDENINSGNAYVKKIFEIFDEAKDAIGEARDYVRGTLFSGSDSEDEDDDEESSEGAEVIEFDPEFLKRRAFITKRWQKFLSQTQNYSLTDEGADLDEFRYVVLEVAEKIESDLHVISTAQPGELSDWEDVIYDHLIDTMVRIRGEVTGIHSFKLILGILQYLNSAIPPRTDELKERLKTLIDDSEQSVISHKDFVKPSAKTKKGKGKAVAAPDPIPEAPEKKEDEPEKPEAAAPSPAPATEPKSQPKPKKKSMYVLRPKNKPLYAIELIDEMGMKYSLQETLESVLEGISDLKRERANQVLRFVLFAFTNAVIDLIVQVEHATGDIPLKRDLNYLRSGAGVVDISKIQSALARELTEDLGRTIKWKGNLTNLAMVAFESLEGTLKLERAFAQVLSAIFNMDITRSQYICKELRQMDVIDLGAKINFQKFTNSRFTMNNESFTFSDIEEAMNQIIFCLQGVDFEREEVVETYADGTPEIKEQRFSSFIVRKPGQVPQNDLEFMEDDLLLFLKESPLCIHDSRKMQAKAEELAQDLNDAYYHGEKRYIATILMPHVLRILKKLMKEHNLIVTEEEKPEVSDVPPPADFLADFPEWEKEQIKVNQEWMEKIIQIHPSGGKLTFEKMLIHALYEVAYKPERIKDLNPVQIRVFTLGLTQLRERSGDFDKKDDKELWSIKDLDPAFLGALLTQILDFSRGSVSEVPNVNQINHSIINQEQVIRACDEELFAIEQEAGIIKVKNKEQKKLKENVETLEAKIALVRRQIYDLQQKPAKYGTQEFIDWMNAIEALDETVQELEAELEEGQKKLISASGEHRELSERKAKVESQKRAAQEKSTAMQMDLVAFLRKFSETKQ